MNGLPTGSKQLPIVTSLEARVRNSTMGYMVWEGERIASKVTQMLKPSNDELELNNGLHGAILTDATTASIHRRLFRYVDTHIPEGEAKVVKGEVLELIQRIEATTGGIACTVALFDLIAARVVTAAHYVFQRICHTADIALRVIGIACNGSTIVDQRCGHL